VENYEPWHWVTIISLEYEEDGTSVYVNILDEGQIKRIDRELTPAYRSGSFLGSIS
jgi:hypothetical protein